MLTWLNGQLMPSAEAQVPAATHSLHYSGAVFEGIRVYNGKAFKLVEHLERLLNSAMLLEYPELPSLSELIKATETTIEATRLANCYVRPLIYRGAESIAIYHQALKTNVLISVSALSKIPKYEDNVLYLSAYTKPSPNSFPPQCKGSGAYSINTLVLKQAKDRNADDALMLGWRGYIAETTSCNVFFVQGQRLITPIADCFLDGITRRTMIKIAREAALEVTEQEIAPAQLAQFTECFVTGTAAEVRLVSKILNGEQTINYAENTIGRMLQHRYFTLVGK